MSLTCALIGQMYHRGFHMPILENKWVIVLSKEVLRHLMGQNSCQVRKCAYNEGQKYRTMRLGDRRIVIYVRAKVIKTPRFYFMLLFCMKCELESPRL